MKRPSTPKDLNALKVYRGKDATAVYSKSGVFKQFKDDKGNHWWLLQRTDGSFCKAKVDE